MFDCVGWLQRPQHMIHIIFHHSMTQSALKIGALSFWGRPLISRQKCFSLDEGDHSAQLCIDVQWPFPLRGQMGRTVPATCPSQPPDPLTVVLKYSGLLRPLVVHHKTQLLRILWRMTHLTISLFQHLCGSVLMVFVPHIHICNVCLYVPPYLNANLSQASP